MKERDVHALDQLQEPGRADAEPRSYGGAPNKSRSSRWQLKETPCCVPNFQIWNLKIIIIIISITTSPLHHQPLYQDAATGLSLACGGLASLLFTFVFFKLARKGIRA